MLIEFSVTNYRSFWGTQTLSMSATSQKDLQKENTFSLSIPGVPTMLRSAVVYGPNGGGKSNLIAALNFMTRFVLASSRESQEGERIKRVPFLLNSEGASEPSEFEVVFVQDGIRFQYGFEVTEERVIHEWLLAYPDGKAQRWFERSLNPKKETEEWYFGQKFIGPKKMWRDATRANALFLSTAVQLNSEQLKPVFTWFDNLAIIRHGQRIDREFTIESCENPESCREVLEFLHGADIDVDGIEVKEQKLKTIKFPPGIPENLRKNLQKDFGNEPIKQSFFRHRLSDSDQTVLFPLAWESDGTRKLFAYSAPWLDVLRSGRVLVVDELDNSFHPHIVRYLLKLLHNPATNKKNGQLVFSTHDTSILDSKILRRDQIWFMEKNKEKATQLYPLTDFHPRKNEALEKGYLQGRYGALPYIGEVKF